MMFCATSIAGAYALVALGFIAVAICLWPITKIFLIVFVLCPIGAFASMIYRIRDWFRGDGK